MTTITNTLTPSAASFEELPEKMTPHFQFLAEKTFKHKGMDIGDFILRRVSKLR